MQARGFGAFRRLRERLENLLAQRELAIRERDAAFAAFRSLVDRGVTAELALEIPEEDSSSIEHVRAQVATMNPGGGFVFQQVHNILANVPPENITAMLDAVRG